MKTLNSSMLSKVMVIYTLGCVALFICVLPTLVNTLAFHLPNTASYAQPGAGYLGSGPNALLRRLILKIARASTARCVVAITVGSCALALAALDRKRHLSDAFNVVAVGVMLFFCFLNCLLLFFLFYSGNVSVPQ
jgi:hypothetical protein